MPQAIPFIAAAAATSAGVAFTVGAVAVSWSAIAYVGASLLVGAYQAKRARAKLGNGQRERSLTIRSGVAPRQVALGTVRAGGVLVYAEYVGPKKKYLDTVVAINHGRIGEVLGVYLDDEFHTVADIVDGVPVTGKFGNRTTERASQSFDVTGATSVTLTLPPSTTPNASAVVGNTATWGGSGSHSSFSPVAIASVVGSVVTFTALVTGRVTVDYDRTTSAAEVTRIKLQWTMGTPDQAATTWAGVDTPKWTADHRCRGVATLRALMSIERAVYATGTPNLGMVVRGPYGVWDPRTSTTLAHSSNPALLAAWFRTLPRRDGGMGVPSDWIDWDSVAAAANICDELITVRKRDGSGYESIKRYECHTLLSLDQPANANLAIILGAMAGEFPFTGSKYRCFAGAWRPATVTITDDDVAAGEPIVFAPLTSSFETPPNVVTATIYDASQNWVETGARQVTNASYVTADGSAEEILELDLPATTDERQANYLMGVALEQARPALAGTITVLGKGANLALMDTLQFNLQGYSAIASRTFEVRRRVNNWNGTYTLELVEVRASTWALDADRFLPVAPVAAPDTTALWNVAALTGLSATSGQAHVQRQPDGTVVTRALVQWAEPAQAAVRDGGTIELRWRLPDQPWSTLPPLPGTALQAYIGPLADGGVYFVEARAVNGLSVPGPWTAIVHAAVGKSSAPDAPASLAATVVPGGVLVSWAPSSDPDRAETEVRYGASWAAGTRIFRGTASSFTWPWPAQGAYSLMARHVDTSGNLGATATLALTVGNGVLMDTPNLKPGSATGVFTSTAASTTITGVLAVPNTPYTATAKWTLVGSITFLAARTGDALLSVNAQAKFGGSSSVSTTKADLRCAIAVDIDNDGAEDADELLANYQTQVPWTTGDTIKASASVGNSKRIAITAGTTYTLNCYAQGLDTSVTLTLEQFEMRVEEIRA